MTTPNFAWPGRGHIYRWMGVAAMALPGLANAGPDLDPGTFYQYLAPPRSSLVATVRNVGDATAFVQIQLAELTFDEKGEPHERPLAEEAGETRALLATPPRLIIPAGGSHQARLIYRGPRAAERYFRVRYVPVAPKARDAFALQPEEASAYAETLQAGVGVLKAIGTIMIVSPAAPRYSTRLNAGEQRLRIVNEGNATVRLESVELCKAAEQTCTPGTNLRVRPGQQAELVRQQGEMYRYELWEGERRTSHVYPQAN